MGYIMNTNEYDIYYKMMFYNEFIKEDLKSLNDIFKQLKQTEKRYLNSKTSKHRNELHKYYNLKIKMLKRYIRIYSNCIQDLNEY